MRLGVIADLHGIEPAVRAVLRDGANLGVDRWWALGDLVLFGPDPVAVLEQLHDLSEVAFVRGNTDRYVLTDEQPAPHQTAADAVGSVGLVRRYAALAAGTAWTRGVLDQAGLLHLLAELPDRQTITLAPGTTLLGIHASPASDDGPGIDSTSTDAELATLLGDETAPWVVGGHTHDPTDRTVAGRRLLNPGSVGLSRTPGAASWMLIETGGADERVRVEQRSAAFEVAEVIDAMARRRHPNRDYVAAALTSSAAR